MYGCGNITRRYDLPSDDDLATELPLDDSTPTLHQQIVKNLMQAIDAVRNAEREFTIRTADLHALLDKTTFEVQSGQINRGERQIAQLGARIEAALSQVRSSRRNLSRLAELYKASKAS